MPRVKRSSGSSDFALFGALSCKPGSIRSRPLPMRLKSFEVKKRSISSSVNEFLLSDDLRGMDVICFFHFNVFERPLKGDSVRDPQDASSWGYDISRLMFIKNGRKPAESTGTA